MNRTASGERPGLAVSAYEAVKLVWQASPALTATQAATTLMTGLLPASIAVLQRNLLDKLTTHITGMGTVVTYALALAGVGVLMAIIPDITTYLQAQLSRLVGVRSQDRLFAALNSFPGIARFESPQFMDSVQLARGAGQTASTSIITGTFSSAQSVIAASSLAIALWTVSPVLAFIVLAAASPSIIVDVYLGRKRADLQWKVSGASRRQMFYGSLQTDLYAAKEIRLFGIGDFLRVRMLRELLSINKRQRGLDRNYLAMQGCVGLFSSLVIGAGLIWTVRLTAIGHLHVGDVSMFVLAAAGVQGALGSATTSIANAYQALILFGHYLGVVSADSDLPVTAQPKTLTGLASGIEMRDVWFRYGPDGAWVLRGVSMTIPAGAMVGLVGVNGAGKSTLVKLLCRLYDPDRGAIYWDGVDIRELDLEQLRRNIGAVFQDYMAYDLTASENIGLGDVGRMDDGDSIRTAARLAGIDEAIEKLPYGYDTLLSRIFFDNADKEDPSTGVILSGGQWQRLALARGLMRADRELVILDEPTAGLDAEGEFAVHSRLREARAERTSLLISHRLGSLRDADTIYVISDGVIRERGDHAALMSRDGEYARLFKLQASGYVSDPQPPPARRDSPARRIIKA